MSNKLNDALRTSRLIFEAEKRNFFDTLADFIEANRVAITHSNQFWFLMKIKPLNEDGKTGQISCEYSFGINSTSWSDPFIADICEHDIVKFLEDEYHAIISDSNLSNETEICCDIALPFT